MGLFGRYLADSRVFEDHWWTPGNVVIMPDGGAGAAPIDALKVSTVWRAVNVLAAGVATLPVDVFNRIEPTAAGRPGGAEPARQEPWHNKIRLMPNPFQTSLRWRHQLVGHVVLGGNYYAQKIRRRGPMGPVEWLWPLDPERCRPIDLRSDGVIEYEYVTKTGERRRGLTQEDIFHARGFSRDGVLGVSVIELMRDAVGQSLAAQRQRTSFIRKELRPSVVLEHPTELSDTAWEKLRARFLKAYGGPTNAGTAMVLDEGMKLQSFQISSRDAQFIEGQNFLVEEFLRYIGVPGVLVGYPDKTATYASVEQFLQAFVTHGLAPITKNLEQELTVSLFGGEQDELAVRFNLDGMLRADSKSRGEFYRVLVELGILTRNEVRELENRNPLEGLDEPLTPLNMRQGSQTEERPEPARRRTPPPASPDDGEEEESRAVARARAIVQATAARVMRKEVLAIAGGEGKRGAAERYARNAPAWREWVEEFYGKHADYVAEALAIARSAAEDYCRDHRGQVLSGGLAAVQSWGEEEIARLAALALQEAAA